MKNGIIIFDFGCQYTNLIKNKLDIIGIKNIIVTGDIKYSDFIKKHDFTAKGIIISGSALSVNDTYKLFDLTWFKINVPVLGICYGYQLLVKISNGKIKKINSEFGETKTKIIVDDIIFKKIKKNIITWMNHSDSVIKIPKEYRIISKTLEKGMVSGIKHKNKPIYGFQFHPEVTHSGEMIEIYKNFALEICKIKKGKTWTPKSFLQEINEIVENKYKYKKIIVGLSGGVDSMTMIAVLRKFIKKENLLAVYVDSGLMKDETIKEVIAFCEKLNINLVVKKAENKFFKKLTKIDNPVKKGMIIGELFIRIFEKIAKENNIKVFAQGTIWSDVVESGITKFSSVIKPHHNVGGLPKKINFELFEPFRSLHKNQVRQIASYLKLSKDIVNKKVFPGPGFAIRIDGEVTKEKVKIVRSCTKIIEDIVNSSSISNKIWMAFAILINVDNLGIKGDARVNNKHVIVLRVVESVNSMTVNFSRNIYPLLAEISHKLIHECGVGRVVYDITDKPPATIEWQ
jgi:GMP synthase (glutamine-hydrolysing)